VDGPSEWTYDEGVGDLVCRHGRKWVCYLCGTPNQPTQPHPTPSSPNFSRKRHSRRIGALLACALVLAIGGVYSVSRYQHHLTLERYKRDCGSTVQRSEDAEGSLLRANTDFVHYQDGIALVEWLKAAGDLRSATGENVTCFSRKGASEQAIATFRDATLISNVLTCYQSGKPAAVQICPGREALETDLRPPPLPLPPGASARCRDGWISYSQTRSGTCSHHGGIADW
jgi:hypothetical protein